MTSDIFVNNDSTSNVDQIVSSETLVSTDQTAWLLIAEDRNLHECDNHIDTASAAL